MIIQLKIITNRCGNNKKKALIGKHLKEPQKIHITYVLKECNNKIIANRFIIKVAKRILQVLFKSN